MHTVAPELYLYSLVCIRFCIFAIDLCSHRNMPITLLTAWRSSGWCTMGNIPRIHTTWIIHLALLISAHYCPALTFGIQTDSRRSPALAASRVTETSSSVHHLKSDGSANAELYQLLESKDSPSTTRVLLEGYVSKRRAIGKSLAFLDVVPSKCPDLRANISTHVDLDLTITPVQAILRREFFSDRNMDMTIERNDPILDYDVYHKILQPGTRCVLTFYLFSFIPLAACPCRLPIPAGRGQGSTLTLPPPPSLPKGFASLDSRDQAGTRERPCFSFLLPG